MSNKVATEDTLQKIATLVGVIAGGGETDDWPSLKKLVDEGYAEEMYPVGSQIVDAWEAAAGTSYDVPWDVVHYNDAGDMFLKWHYGFPTTIAFDAPEAIYYAPAGGLAAGQYYITIGMNYGNGWKAGDHINFTLANDMAAGDQLVLSTATDNKNDPTDGMAWNVYAAGSATSKENGVTSNSDTGTELGSTSATGTGYTNGNINAPQRVVYGYNRYSQSAIRQWLNSAEAAGSWWTAQNGWDRPPAQATTVRGFLAGCSEEFIRSIETADVVTAINTAEGAVETYETTHDKIFLPSLQEMYITPQLANTEGEDWDYYKELAEEAGLTGKFAQGSTYPILKTYYINNKTSACNARLRSAARGNAYLTWCIASSGVVYGSSVAYIAYSGSPACIIKKSE